MAKNFTDKFLITILIISGLFVLYDISHKVMNNPTDKNLNQEITVENTIRDKNNDNKNYRVNNKNNKQLDKKESRFVSRYIEDLQYALEDAGLTMESFSDDIKVSFIVNKDGTIECCEVIKSSGSQEIDNIVKKRINSINPYKPIPDFYGDKMKVNVSYGLHKKGMENIPIYND